LVIDMMFSNILIEKLKNGRRVAVLTGAGISAESGVPTFRGENGLWKKFQPEELANVNAFLSNPQLVWEWYNYRKKLISEVSPNPGHHALVAIENKVPEFCLITQNVDGLHRKTGSRRILELHGNIMRSKCMDCSLKDDSLNLEFSDIPKCGCGGMMRPDVVWFGEMLPEDVIHDAFQWAEDCDVFLSIGTSALVHPAASLPMVAKEAGAYVVEIFVALTNKSKIRNSNIDSPPQAGIQNKFKFIKKKDKRLMVNNS